MNRMKEGDSCIERNKAAKGVREGTWKTTCKRWYLSTLKVVRYGQADVSGVNCPHGQNSKYRFPG